MDFFGAISKRRSIRKYQSKAVPKKLLEKALDAARQSPSSNNYQPYKFIVVTNSEAKRKLGLLGWGQMFISQAPAVVVLCADSSLSLKDGEHSVLVDAAIAMQQFVLAATALGLGTCWIGALHENEIKRLLGIPMNWKIVALSPVGYPAEFPSARKKKSLKELVAWEKFA